jgi:hypothetical protein
MRGTKPFNVTTRDTSSVNITSTYSTLVSSVAADASAILIGVSSNMGVVIGLGASGSETDLIAVAASAVQSPAIPILIPKGARLAIKTITASSITSGILTVTFLN